NAQEHFLAPRRMDFHLADDHARLAQARKRAFELEVVREPQAELPALGLEYTARNSGRQRVMLDMQAQLESGKAAEQIARRVERDEAAALQHRNALAMGFGFLEV